MSTEATNKQEMTQPEIRELWEKLQETLGEKILGYPLKSEGWSFGFDRAKRRLGCAKLKRKKVTLSRILVRRGLPEETIDEVMRHEIAHAIDYEMGRRSNHGPKWKELARRCGADPTRTTEMPEEVSPPYRWHRWCPECEVVTSKYYRRPTSDRYVCGDCESKLDVFKAPGHPEYDASQTPIQSYD